MAGSLHKTSDVPCVLVAVCFLPTETVQRAVVVKEPELPHLRKQQNFAKLYSKSTK